MLANSLANGTTVGQASRLFSRHIRINSEKRLLALSRLSVCLPKCRSAAPTGRNFVKICRGTPNLVKIVQQYRALHMKTKECFYQTYNGMSHIKILFKLFTAVRNSTQLDNSPKGTNSCVSIATHNGFVLLTATKSTNTQTEDIVALV
jgi:hypothetical protein